MFILYLILVLIIPFTFLVKGGIYETKTSKYPDISKGYKTKYEVKNEKEWLYINAVASKLYGTIGFALIVTSIICLFLLGEESVPPIGILSIIMIPFIKVIIDKIIVKKFGKK